ncbi:MAG: T9SS type A sorting domain-containing protein [Flavobacteriales bacterium]|nr:T9SS type A sorting domain-containing protein [Flavobacteriales bacterium]
MSKTFLTKSILGVLFIINLMSLSTFAQTCLPNGITFNSQTEIDDFPNDYPGCSQVLGEVRVFDFSGDVKNLDSLAQINSIGGELFMFVLDSLQSIQGLQNLDSVKGGLRMINVSGIQDLQGLNSLKYVSPHLEISRVDHLISLSGLDQLNRIDGNLIIDHNANLKSLSGLENVVSIRDTLEITWHDSLLNLNGLNGLKTIGGRLMIESNDGLLSLDGIDSLNHVYDGILIAYNDYLSDIQALDNISPDSLPPFTNSGTGLSGWGYYFHHNDSISHCDLNGICDYVQTPNSGYLIAGGTGSCTHNGALESSCFLVTNIVEDNENDYFIFPNPTSDDFYLDLVVLQALELRNAHGQRIWRRQFNKGLNHISTEHLDPGIYFLINSAGRASKLVIQ